LPWSNEAIHDSLIAVYLCVCATDNHGNSNFERIANPQKSGHCDWSTRFDLLPMASGKSERNHIFLAVAAPFAEVLDSLAQSFKEFDMIYHAATFTFAGPETPRAD
jgi:hypothetical protein